MSEEYYALCRGQEQLWLNGRRLSAREALAAADFGMEEIKEAEARLLRFAPLIARLFPETEANGGIIESPLTEISHMREALGVRGRLFIKRDSELDIAGSVKARGGIYEVLKHTEDLLAAEGLLSLLDMESDSGEHIDRLRRVLSRYTIQVGSTGNLGLSIGIMSAALGYRAIVHMSCDAKEWKKTMLRGKESPLQRFSSRAAAPENSSSSIAER